MSLTKPMPVYIFCYYTCKLVGSKSPSLRVHAFCSLTCPRCMPEWDVQHVRGVKRDMCRYGARTKELKHTMRLRNSMAVIYTATLVGFECIHYNSENCRWAFSEAVCTIWAQVHHLDRATHQTWSLASFARCFELHKVIW